jgi:hypothetical protein
MNEFANPSIRGFEVQELSINSEKTVTITICQAITKCSLFQQNLGLLVSPYRFDFRVIEFDLRTESSMTEQQPPDMG